MTTATIFDMASLTKILAVWATAGTLSPSDSCSPTPPTYRHTPGSRPCTAPAPPPSAMPKIPAAGGDAQAAGVPVV